MKLIDKVIVELEELLRHRREEFPDDPQSGKVDIQIVGQMSLLMNEEVNSKIDLSYTKDVDAILKGSWGETKAFRDALKANGLEYDELSKEVWLPNDAEYIEYYNSDNVRVSYLDPISALTSKAVKAKEKNRILVGKALAIYGERLATKIKSHGGDLGYFSISKSMKL